MPSKGGKTSNPKLSLRVIGGSSKIPHGLLADGKDCDGLGRYYYVANPQTGSAALAHTVGTQILLWRSSRRGRSSTRYDAPYEPADVVTEKQAEAALKAVNKGISTRKGKSISGFKGTWRGYVECHPKGPQVVLYRDVPSYGRIVCVSEFAKGKKSARWDVAVVLRNRKWYTRGQKTVSMTQRGVPSLAKACNIGYQGLLDLVARVEGVKELLKSPAQRKAAAERAAKKPAAAKKRAAESVAAKRKKATDVKVTVPKSIAALVGKKIRITNGRAALGKSPVKVGQFAQVIAAAKRGDEVVLQIATIKQGGGLVKTPKYIAVHRTVDGKKKRTFTVGQTVDKQFALAKKIGAVTQEDLKAAAKKAKASKPATRKKAGDKKAGATNGAGKAGAKKRRLKPSAQDKKFQAAKYVSLKFGGAKQTGKVVAKLDLPAGEDDWNKAVMTIELPNGTTTSGTLAKYLGKDNHELRVKGGADPAAAFRKEQAKAAKGGKDAKPAPKRRATPTAAVAPAEPTTQKATIADILTRMGRRP